MGFGSFVHHATHSISHPSSSGLFRHGPLNVRHGGLMKPLGSNPSTWSPIPITKVPTENPFSGGKNPFADLIKKIEKVIPSSSPQHIPSHAPEIGESKSLLTNPLILLGLGAGLIYFLKK